MPIEKYILIFILVFQIGCSKKEKKLDLLNFHNNEVCKNENFLNEIVTTITLFDNFDSQKISDRSSKDRQEKIKNEILQQKSKIKNLCDLSKYLNDTNQALNNEEILLNKNQFKTKVEND